jgi:hypothetical protein
MFIARDEVNSGCQCFLVTCRSQGPLHLLLCVSGAEGNGTKC